MAKSEKRTGGVARDTAAEVYDVFARNIRRDADDPGRYVHRPTGLLTTVRADGAVNHFRARAKRLDPFILLTALRSSRTANFHEEQVHLAPPFVTLLIGPYGTGKTEFVLRVCQFLRDFPAEFGARPAPLPINLALCRPGAKILAECPTEPEFAQLIFGPLLGRDPAAIQETARAVRAGETFLILDALDELVDYPEGHANFFSGLRNFLTAKGGTDQCRVLVTMRAEYFHAIEHHAKWADTTPVDQQYVVLDKLNPRTAKSLLEVALIEVDYFTDDQIGDYLNRTLGRRAERVFERAARQYVLFSSLHRPLLLRVFVDLISANPTALESITEGSGHPADLIAAYVKSIDDDAHWRQAKLNELAGVRGAPKKLWDFDQLARECMALYSRGESALDRAAIARVVGSSERGRAQLLVHKCSFLVHDLDVVRFAHRVFFEYFTARGVVLDMEAHWADGKSPDQSEAFNEYVLNSDMRKFLRRMVQTSEAIGRIPFHELTERSSGLKDPAGWPMGTAKFEELKPRLKKCQARLVDGMTAPDPRDEVLGRDPELAAPKAIAAEIRRFLNWNHAHLHPLYLVYCYHAVATYLKPRWLDETWEACRWEFDAALRGSLDRAEKKVNDAKAGQPWQHLVERILFCAGWLRLRWVPEWLKDHPRKLWLHDGWEEKSRNRLDHILNDLRKLFDLRDGV